MYQGFAGVDGVAATFSLLGSLRGLIHPAVGFPSSMRTLRYTARANWDVFLCALRNSQPADSRLFTPETANNWWITAPSQVARMWAFLSEPKHRDE
jgi:hypothetical protein